MSFNDSTAGLVHLSQRDLQVVTLTVPTHGAQGCPVFLSERLGKTFIHFNEGYSRITNLALLKRYKK